MRSQPKWALRQVALSIGNFVKILQAKCFVKNNIGAVAPDSKNAATGEGVDGTGAELSSELC